MYVGVSKIRMNKTTIIIITIAAVVLGAVFVYSQRSVDTFSLSKHYSYYEKLTYNDGILSENILSIRYGDYVTNRYGVRCVQELISLQNFEGETLHNTRRLISVAENGSRYLCGYYIPNSNKYAFYNDKTIMPLGLIPQYPASPLNIGETINTINVTNDDVLCSQNIVSDQTIQIGNSNYQTKLIRLTCDSPSFDYSLETYFSDETRITIIETETYTINNNTYSIYRELIDAK